MNTAITDKKINIDGIQISYEDEGTGELPVLFIHGFPFDKSMWQPQLDYLKSFMRVVTFDLRGYGQSEKGDKKISIELFANDIVELMDALKIQRAIVCGLSMGGYILLNAVSRFPEKFAALVLSDTQCIADTPETREKRLKSIEQLNSGGLEDFTATFINNIFCKDSLDHKKEITDKIRRIILSTSIDSITATLTALAERKETCSTLSAITVPTLIICGKEDKITPPVQAEFFASNISSSVLHIIENAGHMSNLEQAGEFNSHLKNFIVNLRVHP